MKLLIFDHFFISRVAIHYSSIPLCQVLIDPGENQDSSPSLTALLASYTPLAIKALWFCFYFFSPSKFVAFAHIQVLLTPCPRHYSGHLKGGF